MEERISFAQMQGSLGSLLWLWSNIERAARKEVARAYAGQVPKSAHGIAAVLNAWKSVVEHGPNASPPRTLLAFTLRSQLQHHLDIRNGICHGLLGISASRGNEPATLTWDFNDEKRSINWQELQIGFAWLSKVPFAISTISNSRQQETGSRLIYNCENRNWWMSEFGLEFPGSK